MQIDNMIVRMVVRCYVSYVSVNFYDNNYHIQGHILWEYSNNKCKGIIKLYGLHKTDFFKPILAKELDKDDLINLIYTFALIKEIEINVIRDCYIQIKCDN